MAESCTLVVMRDITHINDPELLKQLLVFYEQMMALLTKDLAATRSELASLRGESKLTATQQELFDLKQRLLELEKKLYGSTSERRTDDNSDREQSPDPASDKPDIPEKKTRKQRGHGPRPQPALPIIDVPLLFDQADLICPHCGKPMRVIDGHDQVSFEVDIIPAQLVLKRYSQQKAACNSGCLQQRLPATMAAASRLLKGLRCSSLGAVIPSTSPSTSLLLAISSTSRLSACVAVMSVWDYRFPFRPSSSSSSQRPRPSCHPGPPFTTTV